jgi:thiol peroxidase
MGLKSSLLSAALGSLATGAPLAAERPGLVSMGGQPVTLLGSEVKIGQKAPDFTVVDVDWKQVRLSDFQGRVVLISAVPSLDTQVCSLQTKRFNAEAAGLGQGVEVLTISEDLPFAQARFCKAEKVAGIRILSDTVARDFGLSYGILIKGRSLLARSIFVVDGGGIIRYLELVPDLSHEPDYAGALNAARKAAGR